MAVKLSALKPSLQLELPGIIMPALDDAIVRVARQFFWQAEAWKYTSDNGKDWTANTPAVPTLNPGSDIPADTVVKRIDTIQYDADGAAWDDFIDFKTRDELDRSNPDWYTETGTSPSSWTIDNSGEARIVPITLTTVTRGLLLRAIIAPNGTVDTTIPDFLFFEFEEAIKAGVWAQLMKQPGKDWSDPQQGLFYTAAFDQGIKRAKSRAEAGYGQPKETMAYGGL
jgi:hypothetical protein